MIRLLKICFFIICACSLPFAGQAQINLVHNGSFEDTIECPSTLNQIYLSKYWTGIDTPYTIYDTTIFAFGASIPELEHSCSSYLGAHIPNNILFYRNAHFGNAMAQMTMYNNNIDTTWLFFQRDYLQGRLKNTLIAGKQYCVTFYTTIEQASTYALSHIGAYLDDASIDTTARSKVGLVHSIYHPQVYDTSISNDTLRWTKIQGIFTAVGTEKFITIGNFFENDQIDTIQVHYPSLYGLTGPRIFSWYLIDDVSVIAADAVANAGRDTIITQAAGDSAWVGVQGDYVPCRWYSATGALIDSNIGGFKVKPAATTSYIMELEVCGHVTRDTVTITVKPVSIVNGQLLMVNVRVYPNPATDEVTVENAQGMEVAIYDVVGRKVSSFISKASKDELDIAHLRSGTYLVKITDPHSGENATLRLVKE